MTINGHWQAPFDIYPDDWFGFTYLITNTVNGKKYTGKKQFHYYVRKKVAGRTNRKRITIKSDWETYTGSSKTLNNDIQIFGKEFFRFEIISLHETKASLYYREIENIIKRDALRSNQYYNKAMGSVKFVPPYPTPREYIYDTESV
jgi:hypothetical protein